MFDTPDEEQLHAMFQSAAQRAIEPGVVPVLDPRSARARAARRAMSDSQVPQPVWSVADAARLLEAHAGPAGAILADLMLHPPCPVDTWVLLMLRRTVGVVAGRALREVFRRLLPYDADDGPPEALCDLINASEPVQVGLVAPESEPMQVSASTGFDALKVATLIAWVETRRGAIPYRGSAVEVPINDDCLADLLLQIFGQQPESVAEAVRALRQLSPGKDGELLRVLRSREDLRSLAEAVNAVLRRDPSWQ